MAKTATHPPTQTTSQPPAQPPAAPAPASPAAAASAPLPPNVVLVTITLPVYIGEMSASMFPLDINLSGENARTMRRLRAAQQAILTTGLGPNASHLSPGYRTINPNQPVRTFLELLAAEVAKQVPPKPAAAAATAPAPRTAD